jgi:hypothetical protein
MPKYGKRVRNTLEPDLGNASEGKLPDRRVDHFYHLHRHLSVSSFAGSKPSNRGRQSMNL